jgi:hypothetical protein
MQVNTPAYYKNRKIVSKKKQIEDEISGCMGVNFLYHQACSLVLLRYKERKTPSFFAPYFKPQLLNQNYDKIEVKL